MIDIDNGRVPIIENITLYPNPTRKEEQKHSLYKLVKSKKLIVNHTYQRGEVWQKRKKQELIDSMSRRWPIGSFVIWESPTGTWEILDGQQREVSTVDFIDEKFATHSTISPQLGSSHFYSEIALEFRQIIDNYPIPALLMRNVDKETRRVIFWRLQQASPLTFGEKIHAMNTPLAKFVRHLGDENKLIENIKRSDNRFYRYQYAAMAWSAAEKHVQLGRLRVIQHISKPESRPENPDEVITILNTVHRGLKPFISQITQTKIVYALCAIVAMCRNQGITDFRHLYGYYKECVVRESQQGPEAIQVRTEQSSIAFMNDYLSFASTKPADETYLGILAANIQSS